MQPPPDYETWLARQRQRIGHMQKECRTDLWIVLCSSAVMAITVAASVMLTGWFITLLLPASWVTGLTVYDYLLTRHELKGWRLVIAAHEGHWRPRISQGR